MPGSLHIVHVDVRVKPAAIDAFREATVQNARESLREPGVARFDVIEREDNPTRFMLLEVYKSPAGAAAHKETEHYKRWRDAVASMMAEPRSSVKYVNVFPEDAGF